MHIRKTAAAAVVLAAGLGATLGAKAQEHRLAFSKAENIEVFVEGAGQENWCVPGLNLRAVHGGAPDPAAFARLLPRLGALFKQQCPQAADVNWRSVDAQGQQFAQGTGRAQDGWQAVAAAGTSPAPAQAVQSASATATPRAPTPDSGQPVSATTPAAPSVSIRTTGTDAASANQQVISPATGMLDFAAAGWQPPAVQQRAELAAFLHTVQDQNGCQFVSVFDFGERAAFVKLVSEKVTCGTDGAAQGKGRLRLERSDGAQIARTGELWFSHGLVFDQPVQALGTADIVASLGQNTLWLGLGSNAASQSHHLLRAELETAGGIGIWKLKQVDVLTSQAEVFRQADAIRDRVEDALTSLTRAMPNTRRANLVFADGAEGIWKNKSSDIFGYFVSPDKYDQLLYTQEASRPTRYRNGVEQPSGPWRYERAKNHLFEREARVAQRERREAERLAREQKQQAERLARERLVLLAEKARAEEKNLRRHQELLELAEQGGRAALRSHLERDLSYEWGARSTYARLMAGGQNTLQRIVRVDGSRDEDALVDWPYPMRLLGQKHLKKGWYWIAGERGLDTASLDDDGLPTSLVKIADGQQVHACTQSGCKDLLDPLRMMRVQLQQDDWTPQAAQAVIDEAPKNRREW